MTSQEIVKSVTMCWVFVQQDTYLKLHTADCKKYVVVLTIKVALPELQMSEYAGRS